MSFGTLLVIVLAGLGGPLLGANGRRFVPVVIGEVLAGVLVGPTVSGAVDPANPTVAFLGQVGFAMLMLTVGMHLPLRDARLRASLRGGAQLAAIVVVLAPLGALAAAAVASTGHVAVYAVLLASGSAAVLLPALAEAHVAGPEAMTVMAQVTIADVLTIVAVPIVLQPARTGHALLGGLLVAAGAVGLLGAARALRGRTWVREWRRLSKRRHWALDLRMSLAALFALAWLAQRSGTSVLVAGFGAGVMVAAVGGPKRLSTQMRGVADGFFVPLYFVVLGAQLDLGGVAAHAALLALVGALAVGNVAIHLAATALTRRPASSGLAASAQLGVPAAIASVGLAEHVLASATAAAIVLAALVSLGVCTVGVERLVSHEQARAAPSGRPRPAAPA